MNDTPGLNTIILSIATLVSALSPIFLALINKKAAKTLENSEETRVAAKATAVSVEKVHVAVNSERTKMLEELKSLRDVILELSKDKARLEESNPVAAERLRTDKDHTDLPKAP